MLPTNKEQCPSCLRMIPVTEGGRMFEHFVTDPWAFSETKRKVCGYQGKEVIER